MAALFRPSSSNPNQFRSRAANLSDETHALNEAVAAWGRARWPGCRVLRELTLGERRIDLLFVCTNDVIGVETKGARDNLTRLPEQMKEYRRFAPEVWLVVDSKFANEKEVRQERNVLLHDRFAGRLVDEFGGKRKVVKPHRDELSIMRLIELLWTDEIVRIAERQSVVSGPIHKQLRDKTKLKKLVARLLTGNEILVEVCTELRARPLTGIGSDKATR